MTEQEKWDYILELDEKLLVGGVILSEWCVFMVKEADIAFASNANLASILTSVAGIESYLRAEYDNETRKTLYQLINDAPINTDLRSDLHKLRKFRNKWVHIDDPKEDDEILHHPEKYEAEIEDMAMFGISLLRRIIYSDQWL